jgi:hypothetical protein
MPVLNLMEVFHCELVIGQLASLVDKCQFWETLSRMLSRHFWNHCSHRVDQNPTFNPDEAQA